jgi:hypothetical protein
MAAQTIEYPWTDSEWRERQRQSEEWWRAHAYAPPEPEPEPQPAAPQRPVMSSYTRDVMSRLTAATRTVHRQAQGNGRWTLAEARQMLKDGYSLSQVVERTGWGEDWLTDLAERLAAG